MNETGMGVPNISYKEFSDQYSIAVSSVFLLLVYYCVTYIDICF